MSLTRTIASCNVFSSLYSRFVNAMVYYGVSFSTPTLGGNIYLNFFLASIVEIPANYVGIWSIGR